MLYLVNFIHPRVNTILLMLWNSDLKEKINCCRAEGGDVASKAPDFEGNEDCIWIMMAWGNLTHPAELEFSID